MDKAASLRGRNEAFIRRRTAKPDPSFAHGKRGVFGLGRVTPGRRPETFPLAGPIPQRNQPDG